jgi:hypothetical protein
VLQRTGELPVRKQPLKKRGSQRENALSLLDVLDPHIAIEFKNL